MKVEEDGGEVVVEDDNEEEEEAPTLLMLSASVYSSHGESCPLPHLDWIQARSKWGDSDAMSSDQVTSTPFRCVQEIEVQGEQGALAVDVQMQMCKWLDEDKRQAAVSIRFDTWPDLFATKAAEGDPAATLTFSGQGGQLISGGRGSHAGVPSSTAPDAMAGGRKRPAGYNVGRRGHFEWLVSFVTQSREYQPQEMEL